MVKYFHLYPNSIQMERFLPSRAPLCLLPESKDEIYKDLLLPFQRKTGPDGRCFHAACAVSKSVH